MALQSAEELGRAIAALGEAVEASGGGRGGVRVKLVGLKTFEEREGRGKRGRGGGGEKRGRGRGDRGDRDRGSGAASEENTEDRPAWEAISKQQEDSNILPQRDYGNCRVLWVEPCDASISPSTSSAATTITTNCPTGLDMIFSQENASNLLMLANSLRDHFASLDLLHLSPKDKNQPLTLHMTVLNAVYAQERNRGGSRGGRGQGGKGDWGGYDVRGLVEEFKDVVWADDVLFDRLEVMRMGEVKGEEGSAREGEWWYESVESVLL